MQLSTRVQTIAEILVSRRGRVCFLDVLLELGWVHQRNVDRWQRGELDPLATAISVDDDKLLEAVDAFRRWGGQRFALRTDPHLSATRDRRPLRFTADRDNRWVNLSFTKVGLDPATIDKKVPDLVVLEAREEFECEECGDGDKWLMMDAGSAICMSCADLDHLVFLKAGNATLSRRARKESGLTAIAVRPDPGRRGRTWRLGILVEPDALDRAEQQCFDDEELRARRRVKDAERRAQWDENFVGQFTTEIRLLFPRIPAERAEAIARHTALRGSGRVGRSAAGRALDERAVRHAVVASVRHEDTDYDALLMKGVPRQEARDQIWQRIDEMLTSWS
ncbi:DUF2293 domain-containing protein [Kutzneria sp. CA-103260]|uniref:DUF2293 domain-containing protein n=1 Tax=Kutzneria sp. CA-103260 TaxID=2802641 RepID=UPI001BA82209|nr:DUF2293 domain-containing protein [Kutzneria sp. CA-103260]QUQ72166.1 hypothetical protein JJ691_99540 [Kutzneria sp. CA-103260]